MPHVGKKQIMKEDLNFVLERKIMQEVTDKIR